MFGIFVASSQAAAVLTTTILDRKLLIADRFACDEMTPGCMACFAAVSRKSPAARFEHCLDLEASLGELLNLCSKRCEHRN